MRIVFLAFLALNFLVSNVSFAGMQEPVRSSKSCETLLVQEFSRPPNDDSNGFITDRVRVTVPSLVEAYRRGIFPWGVTESGMGRWYSVTERGILDFADLRISRSDRKFIRKALSSGEFTITFDRAFEQVIRACAEQPRPVKGGGPNDFEQTWIAPQMIQAYTDFHKAGYAHSVEVWQNGKLVGGLYGVFVDGVFAGESMFHRRPNVAKLALLALIDRLIEKGHTFIDTQMSVGLVEKWGSKYVSRQEFQRRVLENRAKNLTF